MSEIPVPASPLPAAPARFPIRQIAVALLSAAAILTVTWGAQHAVWNYHLRDLSGDTLDAMDRDAWLYQARLRGRASDMYILKHIAEADLRNGQAGFANLRSVTKTLMLSRNQYDHVHLLDLAGKELFRCDLRSNGQGVKAYVEETPAAALQDKSKRPYYLETLAAPPAAVVYSPIDLNIEYKETGQPRQPVVRIGGQIVGPDGRPLALLVMNYFGNQLLHEFLSPANQPRTLFLLNAEGYWLVGPDAASEWTYLFPDQPQANLKQQDPELWKRLTAEKNGWFFARDTLYCFSNIDPLDDAVDYPVQRMPLLGGDNLRTLFLSAVPGDKVRAGVRRIRSTIWCIGLAALAVLVPVLVAAVSAVERRQAALRELHRTLGELRESQASLHEAVGHLEAFSSSVAHDFRGPLRNIQNYAELVVAEEKDLSPDSRHMLNRILFSATRLNRLALDLLEYSKVSMGGLLVTPVDLDQAIPRLLRDNEEFDAADIAVRSPLGSVAANPTGFDLAFLNLLRNAVKYAKPEGPAKIRIHSEARPGPGAWRRLWIEDEGIGIDPAHQERIFHVFERLHNDDNYGGTGIGLALVRKAILRMGGQVGVESVLGQGSRFWIDLPAREQA